MIPSPIQALIKKLAAEMHDVANEGGARRIRAWAQQLDQVAACLGGPLEPAQPNPLVSREVNGEPIWKREDEIRELLHPTRPHRCAEPLDIEDARWLLMQVDHWRTLWLEAMGELRWIEATSGLPPSAQGWQPIETYDPKKDAAVVMLFWGGRVRQAKWLEVENPPSIGGTFRNWLPADKGAVLITQKPTHWMPLPSPPASPRHEQEPG